MLRATPIVMLSAVICGIPATGMFVANSFWSSGSTARVIDVEKDVSPFDQPLAKVSDRSKKKTDSRKTTTQDKAKDAAKDKARDKAKDSVKANDTDKSKSASKKSTSKSKSKSKSQDKVQAKAGSKNTEKEPAGKVASIATLRLSGALPEINAQTNPFGKQRASLHEILRRLDKASKDDSISAVLIELRGLSVGRGGIHELREAIKKTRRSGKRVYANLETATPASYLVALACDEIRMPESGMLVLPGVRAEISFYKRLLKKVDVQADFLQMGDYKGAAEPMTRDSMSKEFRSQYGIVIDDMYEQMVETICKDRRLSKDEVEEIIDRGVLTVSRAYKAGLIDAVAYDDEFAKMMRKNLQADTIKIIKNYGEKKVDNDFSGMMGLVKLMEVMMGGDSSARTGKAKKIAVVYAVGAITTGKSQQSLLGSQTIGSDTIIKALRKANDDDSVKAIVLRVNSPGGSALASDLIWRQICEIKKPVVASMGDVAASGGYYISMGCDKILAEPGTITGSIGVVSGKLAFGKLYDKIGISTEVISRGANSGIFSSQEKFSSSERKVLEKMMEETYDQFTRKAADGRDMKRKELLKLAGGRIWTGRQAESNGLVDRVGTLADAIAMAQKLAGIEESEELPILVLPQPKSLFEEMFGGPDVTAARSLQSLVPEAALSPLQQLETLKKLFSEPTVLMLPYAIEIH